MTTRPPDPPVHPAAAVWPMLPDDELDRLAESIRTNGLLEPIVLTPDGELLDGRNRLAACQRAKVKPTTVTYDGDPVEYVLARNNDRRHMTTGQRAMATALTLAQHGKRHNGRWKRGTVPDIREVPNSTWRDALSDAGVVLDEAPDLAPLVVAGTVVLSAAYLTARERRAQADTEQARMDRLDEAAPDLAGQVRDETLTLTEAEGAQSARARKAEEERRDARNLLTRIVELIAPAVVADGSTDAWAARIGQVEPELLARLDTGIDVLTDLRRLIVGDGQGS